MEDFPQKNKVRGERRKDKERKRAKALDLADKWISPSKRHLPEMQKWKEEWAAKHSDNLAKCSCWMCGHRRALEGPTIQEKRFFSEPVVEDD